MLRCSKKAHAKCPARHLCDPIEDATFTEDSECAAFNREVEYKPMTNADRIRAMSNEELAAMFVRACADECPPGRDWYCAKDEYGWDACEACWANWLQKPAEED